MSLNYVTLILDLFDGQGNAVSQGWATLTPSATLTDTADNEIVTQAPIAAQFRNGLPDQVSLLATDNGALAPSGWGWSISFTGVPGNPAGFSFFLPFSGGATQRLSHLSPVSSVVTMQAYMPLPTGTPVAGQVPAVISNGSTATQWVNQGGGGGAVSSVFTRTGAVVATSGDYAVGQVTGAAPLASPALTGTPTAPTASALTNSTQLASTAYADAAVSVEKTRALAGEAAAQAAAQAASLPIGGGSLTGSLTVGGAFCTTPVTLTDAASIAVNAALSDVFKVTLGGNRTLASPANPVDGQAVTFQVIQDGTGSRTLAYGAAYQFPASIGTPVLSTTPGFRDWIAFRYDVASTTWWCVGFTPQQANPSPLSVSQGGTGQSSLTAFTLLAGGTTGTGALQQVAAGSSGQILTSQGGAALPSFQALDSTASDIAPVGTAAAAGATGKVPDAGHVHASPAVIPADLTQIGWTVNDPGGVSAAVLPVSGTLYLMSFPVRQLTAVISHIGVHVTIAGATLTAGDNLMGIYGPTGTLLGQIADQSGVWTGTGGFNPALVSNITNAAAGKYWVGLLAVGTTTPTFRAGAASAVLANLGLSGAALRYAINGTGLTSLPGSVTLSSNVSAGAFPIAVVIS